MYAVTVRPESIARGRLTVTGPKPRPERRSHQFRLELTAEGSPPDEYGYPVDIDRTNEAPDELLEFEVQMREEETTAAACAVER